MYFNDNIRKIFCRKNSIFSYPKESLVVAIFHSWTTRETAGSNIFPHIFSRESVKSEVIRGFVAGSLGLARSDPLNK